MSSSCSTAPLVVWKRPPSASRTESRRFFLSVGVIRSPAGSSPRRTPDSTAGCSVLGSPTGDPEEAELPARAVGGLAHVGAGAEVDVLVGLAHGQHDEVGRGLLLQGGQQLVRGVVGGRGPVAGLGRGD